MPRSVKQVLVLSTGGTFQKIYDPIRGELLVDPEANALRSIAERWRCELEFRTIIGKDSLEMDDTDRETIRREILSGESDSILVIHGTDTMEESARYLSRRLEGKRSVVFTGAMVPYSIDPVEATANFALGMGALLQRNDPGVFIAMNGWFGPWNEMTKNRVQGRFEPSGTA